VGAACRYEPEPSVAAPGKHQEAYDLLAPVYGWFTEGFDTLNLQTANRCLRRCHERYGRMGARHSFAPVSSPATPLVDHGRHGIYCFPMALDHA